MLPLHLRSFDDAPSPVTRLRTKVGRRGSTLFAKYRLFGDLDAIALPDWVSRVEKRSDANRADNLWQHSCFELFIRPDGGHGYLELNFSPSGQWAAYWFEGERVGMRDAEVWTPAIVPNRRGNRFNLDTRLEFPAWADQPLLVKATAIVEASDGTKTYWAATHSTKGKPDFHDPACFTLELPPVPATPSPRT